MRHKIDFIIINQSEIVNYEEYAKLPLDRIELYREIVFPRMVYHNGAFRSHLDVINILRDGVSFRDSSFEERRRLLSIWNLPSVAGMHLANYLLSEGFHTCIINNFDAEWDRFCDVYASCQKRPLVGISTTFHLGFGELRRICRKLREFDADMDIVAGGAFTNTVMQTESVEAFEKPMRRCGVDYVLHGFNSEKDLLALLKSTKMNGDVQSISNLACITKSGDHCGEFQSTAPRWNPPLLDEAPALWHQLDLPTINHTVQMRTSCGCPFSCAFCSYPQVARGFSKMNVEAVRRSIESLLKIPNINRIVFIDDTFNVPRSRFKEMCRLFAEYDFEWHSFLRVQFIDEDTAKLMRDSGCQSVYLGIESANDDVLRNMNKKARRKDFERGVGLLRKHGIASMAALVLGFPGETEKTILDNRHFIENSGVEFYTLKEFYYMEHTPVHADREKYGLKGMGNKWSHDTMDSKTAYEHKISLFKEIKSSCFVDPDSSLWHLVLMMDAGFSLDQISALQEQINAIVSDQLDGDFSDNHPALDRLRQLLVDMNPENRVATESDRNI